MLVATGLVLAGCATVPVEQPVKAGDRTGVRFTCRLSNGDIAVTTEKSVAENTSLRKSVVFLPRGEADTLAVTAADPPSAELVAFEDRVTEKIAAAVVGMTPGKPHTMQIRGDRNDNAKLGAESTIKVARVIHRPKEMTLGADTLTEMTGKPPAAGDVFSLGKEQLPATVVSVKDGTVSVRFTPEPGMRIDTPFGTGKVRETPEDFEIAVDGPVGSLVRSGPLVGRILDVGDTDVTIDYGHPFGGEELTCDVVVEPLNDAAIQGAARAE